MRADYKEIRDDYDSEKIRLANEEARVISEAQRMSAETERVEAEEVRRQMLDVIARYGFVTVADMYDMAGLTPPYTANSYGWVNIRTAEPVRVRDGYILRLPKASPID